VLSGKAYDRAMTGHMLIDSATNKILYERLLPDRQTQNVDTKVINFNDMADQQELVLNNSNL
jgi:hypothetical protein